ncbi:hypothetical protein IFU01_18070 [Oxalobacteraceae sp. CFBP 8763]|nr:hypothetical protein [Oxalobacteraceae sp. CFBP 8763]
MQTEIIKEMLLQQAAEAVGRPGAGLTREYIFEPRYAAERSLGAILGAPRKTVLQYIFDEIDNDERDRVFPDPFDLGNLKAPKNPTKAALRAELERSSDLNREEDEDPENALRYIKEAIGTLTGHHYDAYFEKDPGKSLKVLKMLYILNRKVPDRMLSLLKPPASAAEASLEVANPHPLEENIAASALLADLKGHLTLEMPAARRREIDELFDPLRDRIGSISSNLVKVAGARSRNERDRMQALLVLILQVLNQVKASDDGPMILLPLDEQLYIHCWALEISHLVEVDRYLHEEKSPGLAVKEVGRQLRLLSVSIQGKANAQANDQCVPVSELETISVHHGPQIQAIIVESLGYKISATHFRKSIPLAEKLIRLWMGFNSSLKVLAFFKNFKIDPLMAVAAITSVAYHRQGRTKYRPYWLGQEFDRGRVIGALEKLDLGNSETEVEEEYNRFWTNQLDWFRYAMAGQLRSYELSSTINHHLLVVFERVARRHDTELLRTRLNRYTQLPAQVAVFIDQRVA